MAVLSDHLLILSFCLSLLMETIRCKPMPRRCNLYWGWHLMTAFAINSARISTKSA